jgi:hypothetical protein
MCNPQCPVSKLLDAPKRERHARPPGIGLRLGRVADRGLDPIEILVANSGGSLVKPPPVEPQTVRHACLLNDCRFATQRL